ncbi:dual specificity protein phosphatase family protein [Acinetobacter sp. c3-l95]|uniref:dual specificity protein phosphatase family protein n=1 Tax=Acinetobacter sp. c3-l95 TaxID=3342804 RepID=UPI0035BA01CF
MNKRRAIIFMTAMTLSSCIQHQSLPAKQRPQYWATMVDKQHNLYRVNSMLYRSEQPLHEQNEQLKKLGIQRVISLRARNQTANELDQQAFKLQHIPINTWAIDRDDVLATMRAVKQAKAQGETVLIHCYHGSDRTGTMIAMYRILFENWQTDEAMREMKFGGYGFHPIWVNIDKLFTPENIAWLKTQLANS